MNNSIGAEFLRQENTLEKLNKLRYVDIYPNKAEAHRVFKYKGGRLYFKERKDRDKAWNTKYAGKLTGTYKYKGTAYTTYNNRKITVSRLLWIMYKGPLDRKVKVHNRKEDRDRIYVKDLYLV